MKKKVKKDTKIIITTAIIAVIILLIIILINFGTKTINQEKDTESSEIPATSQEKTIPQESNPLEMQKYAEFEAELTCKLMTAKDAESVFNTIKETDSLMKKYDYTDEEFQRISDIYKDDESFKELAVTEMKKICPELVEKFITNP